ncbi:helix-turn-helix domain-containing protein [Peptoanaerobacter stomatis]|uniref:helix-turn-helix domain-containing protein n=1 Tax=Peptoanaerobacter stomatis TaxID=796937 RepID=UPI003FA0DCD9
MKLNATKIKMLCIQHNITMRELANGSKMSVSTLSQVMNGRNATANIINKLAIYFNITVDELIKGE